MSAQEFHDHYADYCESPWGEDRADHRSGIVAATIANVNRGKNQKPFKVRDFMPYAKPEEQADTEQTFDDLQAFIGVING